MTTWPYTVLLDRRVCLTGVYQAGNDRTVWTMPFLADPTINTVVLSSDFGANAGEVITPDSVVDRSVIVNGRDLSGGVAAVGRGFDMSVELSRVYVRDNNQRADLDAWVTIRHLVVSYFETSAFCLRAAMTNRSDREEALSQVTPSHGWHRARFNGESADLRLFIENDQPKPCFITALEIGVDYAPRHGGT